MVEEKEYPVRTVLMSFEDIEAKTYAENFYVAIANDELNLERDSLTYLVVHAIEFKGAQQVQVVAVVGQSALKQVLEDIIETGRPELTREIRKFTGDKRVDTPLEIYCTF